jgi:hypothetical protein
MCRHTRVCGVDLALILIQLDTLLQIRRQTVEDGALHLLHLLLGRGAELACALRASINSRAVAAHTNISETRRYMSTTSTSFIFLTCCAMSASSKHFKYLRPRQSVTRARHVLVANIVEGLSLLALEPMHKVLRANELAVQLELFGLLARVD